MITANSGDLPKSFDPFIDVLDTMGIDKQYSNVLSVILNNIMEEKIDRLREDVEERLTELQNTKENRNTRPANGQPGFDINNHIAKVKRPPNDTLEEIMGGHMAKNSVYSGNR